MQAAVASQQQEVESWKAAHDAVQSRLTALQSQVAADPSALPVAAAAELRTDNAAYMQELIETVEQLNIARRQLDASTRTCSKLRAELQQFSEQHSQLYSEHAQKVSSLQAQLRKAREQCAPLQERAEAAETAVSRLSSDLRKRQGEPDEATQGREGAVQHIMIKLKLEKVLPQACSRCRCLPVCVCMRS